MPPDCDRDWQISKHAILSVPRAYANALANPWLESPPISPAILSLACWLKINNRNNDFSISPMTSLVQCSILKPEHVNFMLHGL